MPKVKQDEYLVNISFRLYGDEARRWDAVRKAARKVDEEADKTDVVRALLRLPPKKGKPEILTDADRNYFIGKDHPSVTYIKLVGRVSAGKVLESFDESELIPVLTTDVEGVQRPRALKVEGDSMMDANVMDGDLILVGDCADPRNRIVVAYVFEKDAERGIYKGATLKRWRQHGHNVTLEPANPNYEPKTYKAKDLRWYGALIKVLRTFPKPDITEQKDWVAA